MNKGSIVRDDDVSGMVSSALSQRLKCLPGLLLGPTLKESSTSTSLEQKGSFTFTCDTVPPSYFLKESRPLVCIDSRYMCVRVWPSIKVIPACPSVSTLGLDTVMVLKTTGVKILLHQLIPVYILLPHENKYSHTFCHI